MTRNLHSYLGTLSHSPCTQLVSYRRRLTLDMTLLLSSKHCDVLVWLEFRPGGCGSGGAGKVFRVEGYEYGKGFE